MKMINPSQVLIKPPAQHIMTRIKLLLIFSLFSSCENQAPQPASGNRRLKEIFASYWEKRMQLYPLEATAIGDNRYNDRLPVWISDSYRDTLRQFYQSYHDSLRSFTEPLNMEDSISRDVFAYEMQLNLEALRYDAHLMPINQFWSFTLEFPQLGSGDGNQPFHTVKDYDDFLKRMQGFPAWIDTAISNMRRGMQSGMVLPKVLAQKMLPQLEPLCSTKISESIFYQPINKIPDNFPGVERERLAQAYRASIEANMIPAYTRLRNFIEQEYLPACRTTHGLSAIPKGNDWYQFLIRQYTTTQLSPDSIYQLGLKEVARLHAEMDKVKQEVGFHGTLSEFFSSINADPQFYPFTEANQVLDSFAAIQSIMKPQLRKLFESEPKTPFEIRQTEAFRAASASAEYNAGSEDGTRPGIFYVPILDPRKFNIVGMETLFLHEAIPGHHYQISLQQENKDLPQFRKFLGYSAYAEGWALYTETLGRDLGLYSNPYQYLGHLSDAMHRAIRLVVDVAIHTKGMSREEAIAYMQANERISAEEATAEIERYMAIPGQALSYKIGQITLSELRTRFEHDMGASFHLAEFHTQVLNGGNMPLEILQKKLERWKQSKLP